MGPSTKPILLRLMIGDVLPKALALFMDEIKLPTCHVVALSKGSIVAIGLAVYHPNKFASLFLAWPLGLEEAADVADGQREIVHNWKDGLKTGQPDMEVLSDAAYGTLQLGFSNKLDSLISACV